KGLHFPLLGILKPFPTRGGFTKQKSAACIICGASNSTAANAIDWVLIVLILRRRRRLAPRGLRKQPTTIYLRNPFMVTPCLSPRIRLPGVGPLSRRQLSRRDPARSPRGRLAGDRLVGLFGPGAFKSSEQRSSESGRGPRRARHRRATPRTTRSPVTPTAPSRRPLPPQSGRIPRGQGGAFCAALLPRPTSSLELPLRVLTDAGGRGSACTLGPSARSQAWQDRKGG